MDSFAGVQSSAEINHANVVNTGMYDAVGVDQLELLLRARIEQYLSSTVVVEGKVRKGSYNLLCEATGISHTFIWKFHKKEQSICITNMNKLANFFDVRYFVENF